MFIKLKLDNVFKVMSMQSTVFSEFFYMLMTDNTIDCNRNGIKVLIFFYYCEVVSSHIGARSMQFKPIVACVTFCVHIFAFVLTISVRNPLTMMRIVSIMVVIAMGYTLLVFTDENEIIETHYSLPISIILMMYTLFRLKFLITILMSTIYIMLFISLGNKRLTGLHFDNNTEIPVRALEFIRYPTPWKVIENRYIFLIGQCILFCLVYLTGIYLRFLNSIRRKSAFLKLAQYAEAKLKTNSAVKVQIYWIEAIMPLAVKDEFLKNMGIRDTKRLVYCKKFDNVSILFADIVGFTAMSSNKTAEKLVYLLNDLYNRFDEYGRLMNCEKIGTLGDCYYCVSGCPIARPDHALGCVEMGLGMCEIILQFNKDHKEDVNMRVGIHSGRVIAAIIGSHRFRFDVFSNDVIIANSLESSGEAGRVHVSDETYKLIRHAYNFEEGEMLEIKREEDHGIGGLSRKNVKIKTYFVLTKDKNQNDNYYNNSSQQFGRRSVYQQEVIMEGDKDTVEYQQKNEKMKYHLDLIKALQRDPEKPVDFFQNPPIHPITLQFTDKEIEAHFLNHSTDQVKKITIDSYKFALLMDCVACLIFSTTILAVEFIMLVGQVFFTIYTPIIYFSGIIVTIISLWVSLKFKSKIHNETLQTLFGALSHPLTRLLLGIYISCLPNLLVLSMYQTDKMYTSYSYTATYFTLTMFALIGNCIFTSSSSIIKQLSTIICASGAIYIILYPLNNKIMTSSPGFQECTTYLLQYMQYYKFRVQCSYIFQLFHICFLIFYLTRENEKNMRMHFFATREAEIRNDEARRAQKVAESLLYNIIPRHVFSQIMKTKGNSTTESSFSYAHAISTAGVVFACISNFFSDYYREDYKGGESALKLLHSIICRFDNLFRKPMYTNLEKIKTINDCYMIASGLNTTLTRNSDDHLTKLMYFCFEMLKQLKDFNDENIIGSSRFKMKIGYNFGPVTAGIIGTSKPLYDIWGDTVNLSSRMYSTAPPGCIQVSDEVAEKLKKNFKFQYRGKVSMKGKGEVLTHLAIGPKLDRIATIESITNSSDPIFGLLKKIRK